MLIKIYAPSGVAKRQEREHLYNTDLTYLLRDVLLRDFNCVLGIYTYIYIHIYIHIYIYVYTYETEIKREGQGERTRERKRGTLLL